MSPLKRIALVAAAAAATAAVSTIVVRAFLVPAAYRHALIFAASLAAALGVAKVSRTRIRA